MSKYWAIACLWGCMGSPTSTTDTDDTTERSTTSPTDGPATTDASTDATITDVIPTATTSDTAPPGDDLAALDDPFDDPTTLEDWARVWDVEAWPGDQLEEIDIDTSAEGALWMKPYSSGWFSDYRGALAFKSVTGDFVVTTSVHVTDRDLEDAPDATFSLAGILVRTPRTDTAATWTAGNENYVFLSEGARNAGVYSGEIKTTTNSNSTLNFPPGAAESRIRIARIGEHVICLLDVGAGWTVAQWRFARPDFPDTLQVGLTAYTDWSTVSGYEPAVYNQTVLTKEGSPDLVARFDWITFRRPVVPKALVGADLSNPTAVSDADLLTFLGDTADVDL